MSAHRTGDSTRSRGSQLPRQNKRRKNSRGFQLADRNFAASGSLCEGQTTLAITSSLAVIWRDFVFEKSADAHIEKSSAPRRC